MKTKLLILLALTTMPVLAQEGYWSTYRNVYWYCYYRVIRSSDEAAAAQCTDTYLRYNYHPKTVKRTSKEKQ